MPNNGYFSEPFCGAGTKTAVPDALQPDGSVSYTEGYGPDYQQDPATNPNALNIERDKMNQLFYDITSAIKQYQENGVPPFITSAMNGGAPFSYSKYNQALYNGVAYTSLVNGNTDTPPSANWLAFNITAASLFTAGISTGSANAQVFGTTTPSTGFSYAINGQIVTGTAGFTNTGATQFNIDGLGFIDVKKNSGGGPIPLVAGDITTGNSITLTVNVAANCLILNEGITLGTMANENISSSIIDNGSGGAVPAIQAQATVALNHTYAIGDWGLLTKRSNGATAMSDTLPGTIGALPNGWFGYVKNIDTVTCTIAVGAGGSISKGSGNGTIIIQPGETWLIESAGAGAYNAGRIMNNRLLCNPCEIYLGYFSQWLSNTTAAVQALAMIVQQGGDFYRLPAPLNVVLDISTVGANGLDTGVLAANTWYAVYVIYNPTTRTAACLMSLSMSGGIVLPAGYTYTSGVVSAVRTDAAKHLVGFVQYDEDWQYVVGQNLTSLPQMASGLAGSTSAPTYVAVATANFVPAPIAFRIKIALQCINAAGAGAICSPSNSYGGDASTTNPPLLMTGYGTSGRGSVEGEFITESNNIFWASGSANAGLYCLGFKFS